MDAKKLIDLLFAVAHDIRIDSFQVFIALLELFIMHILDIKDQNGLPVFNWLKAREEEGCLTEEDKVALSKDYKKGDRIYYEAVGRRMTHRKHLIVREILITGNTGTSWKQVERKVPNPDY